MKPDAFRVPNNYYITSLFKNHTDKFSILLSVPKIACPIIELQTIVDCSIQAHMLETLEIF